MKDSNLKTYGCPWQQKLMYICVYYTYTSTVMHDAEIIVWYPSSVLLGCGAPSEVFLRTLLDVSFLDGDKVVSVWSRVLVIDTG